jgi:uncharacterized protein (TIGR00369 family)
MSTDTTRPAPGTMPDTATPVTWGEAATRTVTWYDPLTTAHLGRQRSGMAFLAGMRDGELPPPPIASVLNFAIRDIEPGKVMFECTPDESLYNPIGMVHGGLVCTLADTVIGCAVHTTLGVGSTYTSLDLTVSYLRPVTDTSGVLRATGVVTKPGRRVAFATAEIVDGSGTLVATATGSCLVMEVPAGDG